MQGCWRRLSPVRDNTSRSRLYNHAQIHWAQDAQTPWKYYIIILSAFIPDTRILNPWENRQSVPNSEIWSRISTAESSTWIRHQSWSHTYVREAQETDSRASNPESMTQATAISTNILWPSDAANCTKQPFPPEPRSYKPRTRLLQKP